MCSEGINRYVYGIGVGIGVGWLNSSVIGLGGPENIAVMAFVIAVAALLEVR